MAREAVRERALLPSSPAFQAPHVLCRFCRVFMCAFVRQHLVRRGQYYGVWTHNVVLSCWCESQRPDDWIDAVVQRRHRFDQ
jgi:hypothetical protein